MTQNDVEILNKWLDGYKTINIPVQAVRVAIDSVYENQTNEPETITCPDCGGLCWDDAVSGIPYPCETCNGSGKVPKKEK